MYGMHELSHWSRTQQVVSLSSTEAELHALCKAASEGIAAKSTCREMGIVVKLKLLTDASAARGIVL